MTLISSNPSPKAGNNAVVIWSVGDIKAGTTVHIEKITGNTAVVVTAGGQDGIIPIAWLVALPE